MKIGFDAKRVFHNFRGLGNYSRTLVESLIKHFPEEEFVLFTPPYSDQRALAWKKRFENVEVVTPTRTIDRAASSAWRSFFMDRDIARNGVDLYHGLSHELPRNLEKRGIKSVVTIHDLIFMRYPEFFPWIDRKVYFRKFKFAVENADKVVAICEQTKLDLEQFLGCSGEKVEVIQQSCHPSFYASAGTEDKDRIANKYDLDEHYILYVGALEERKNALSLVKAFSRLKDHIPHQLILVGQGKEYKTKIENEILAQGLRDRIKILDNVPLEDLPGLYQMANLFVYPSFFEGWGIPNVEALFSETPVITSLGSCFPESAGPHSLYIDPHSAEDIAEKMEKVLFDDDLQKQMVREGRLYAEQFHWKNTSARMVDLYKRTLL
jgi:glycosyltransferase involved in cell wall biosynthesis